METQAQGKFNGGMCVPFFPTSAVFFTFFFIYVFLLQWYSLLHCIHFQRESF